MSVDGLIGFFRSGFQWSDDSHQFTEDFIDILPCFRRCFNVSNRPIARSLFSFFQRDLAFVGYVDLIPN